MPSSAECVEQQRLRERYLAALRIYLKWSPLWMLFQPLKNLRKLMNVQKECVWCSSAPAPSFTITSSVTVARR